MCGGTLYFIFNTLTEDTKDGGAETDFLLVFPRISSPSVVSFVFRLTATKPSIINTQEIISIFPVEGPSKDSSSETDKLPIISQVRGNLLNGSCKSKQFSDLHKRVVFLLPASTASYFANLLLDY